jgi:hypothetical protein
MQITMEKFLPIHQSIYNYTRNGQSLYWKVVLKMQRILMKFLLFPGFRAAYFFPNALLTREGWMLTPAGTALTACASFTKCARCFTITAWRSAPWAPRSARTGSSQA